MNGARAGNGAQPDMKARSTFITWVALCASAFGAARAQAQPQPQPQPQPIELPGYSLDPTHTFVHWEVLHTGTSTIRGRFDRSSGSAQFDAKAQRIDVGIVIDTASVNSGVKVLDTLLRGAAMLATDANPQAFFIARNARFEGGPRRRVLGDRGWHERAR